MDSVMEIVKGNLVTAFLKNEVDILAHGTNCSNGFGSGIAKEIAERIPEVKEEFHKHYKKHHGTLLGNIQIIPIDNDLQTSKSHVINCYTQEFYGRSDGTLYMSYEAMEQCMMKLARYASLEKLKVGLPKIGCGLAGGDWDKVSEIIERSFTKFKANYKIYVKEN